MAHIADETAQPRAREGGHPWPMALAGNLGLQLVAVLLVVVPGLWAMQFQLDHPPVPLIWPASGVALALFFRFGKRAAVGVGAAVLVLQYALGAGWAEALLIAGGTVVAGLTGAILLERAKFERHLRRLRDVGLFVVIGGGVTAVINGFAGALGAVGLQTGFGETFGLCWAADTMGLLLLAPLLLALEPRDLRIGWQETLAWLIATGGLAAVVYSGLAPEQVGLPLSYAVFPLVMLLALRRTSGIVALALALVAVIAITGTGLGLGPFAHVDMLSDILGLHAQFAILVLSGLFLCAMRTERDQAEEQARHHLAMLHRAGRLKAMSTLAAGIAHEINQPLCAVSSYAQAARRMLRSGKPPQELEEALDRIIAGNEKASGIVRRIREYLHPGERNDRYCRMDAVVAEAVELLQPEARRLGVRLSLMPGDRRLIVGVDRVDLGQVVANLVQNALESAAEAPMISRRWVRVMVRRSGQGECAELTVTDGGRGLPDIDQHLLFEPLVTGRPSGTGLGLAIVRAIVESHGGRVNACDAVGAGAEFHVRLPLYKGGARK